MNKTHLALLGILAIIVVAGGAYALTRDKEMMDESSEVGKEAEVMKKDEAPESAKSDMKDTEEKMTKTGSYEAYAPEKLARADAGDVVLFFHASWCPSCRGLSADIEKNMSSIPADVSILKVDYDTETELKKKYGVTYQHTLVQVSSDGTLIKKWSGAPTLSALVSNIQ